MSDCYLKKRRFRITQALLLIIEYDDLVTFSSLLFILESVVYWRFKLLEYCVYEMNNLSVRDIKIE